MAVYGNKSRGLKKLAFEIDFHSASVEVNGRWDRMRADVELVGFITSVNGVKGSAASEVKIVLPLDSAFMQQIIDTMQGKSAPKDIKPSAVRKRTTTTKTKTTTTTIEEYAE